MSMKISDFEAAVDVMRRLRAIDDQIKFSSSNLGVTLQGQYYTDLADLVRPVVLAELKTRRERILTELGVFGIFEDRWLMEPVEPGYSKLNQDTLDDYEEGV